jgi:hypothetical protein
LSFGAIGFFFLLFFFPHFLPDMQLICFVHDRELLLNNNLTFRQIPSRTELFVEGSEKEKEKEKKRSIGKRKLKGKQK